MGAVVRLLGSGWPLWLAAAVGERVWRSDGARHSARCRHLPALPVLASPRALPKPSQGVSRLAEVLLNLLALVEDRAVARAAEHVLVEVALAALALRPQTGKEHLRLLDGLQLGEEDVDLARLAVDAQRSLVAGQDRLAPQALERDLCELHQAAGGRSGLVDSTGVLALQKGLDVVGQDGLEEALDGLRQLVLQ
eukprot:scaffold4361_cov121-Isochrysis_galbana.AAC.1